MNKNLKKIIASVLLGVSLVTIPLKTYASDIMFFNSTVQDGLSQGTILAMLQDSNGYIWIGTSDGLNKYNGYEYKKFNKGIKKDESIINGFILSLNEDQNKNLWVGTEGGISKINLEDDSITNYYPENSSLKSLDFRDIAIDEKGDVFVSSSSGLYKYDKEKDDFNICNYNEGSKFTSIRAEGNYIYGICNGTLFSYNTENDEYTEIENEELNEAAQNDVFTKIFVYDDTMLIGTNSKGIYVYNIKTNEVEDIKKYYEDGENDTCYSIKSIFRDKDGNIIAGTVNGIVVYDIYGGQRVYTYDQNDKYTLVNNIVLSILQDRSGLIWLGTYCGLSTFHPDEGISYYCSSNGEGGLSGNLVHGIYEDDDGVLWIGCLDNGLTIFDRANNTYDYINTEDGLCGNNISDITGNGEKIFVATEGGLSIIDRKTKEVQYIDELKNKFCTGVYVDGDRLWVGTATGTYIVNLNDSSVSNLNDLYESLGVKKKVTGAMFRDSEGIMWLGLTLNSGLIRYDESTGEGKLYLNSDEENSISDDSVSCINEDKYGNIWIGTANGLNKYDKKTEKFTIYSTLDGMLNNTTYGVLFDDEDNIFISTNAGVESFSFDENNKLSIKQHIKNNEFNTNAAYKLKSGEMAFGSINGIFIVDPSKLVDHAYVPQLKFDYLKVNGIVASNINDMNLNYKNSSISIKLFTTNYDNSKNTKFYYKINNVSEDWTLIDGNEITFSKLASGKYNISFRALNSNGVYTDEETISFKVKAPFWRNEISIFVYFIIFLLSVFYVYRKIRTMDKTIAKSNDQLGKEMQEKNELLLKVLKLEQRKNNYLINISHELRTPLNVISSIQQLVVSLNEKGDIEKSELKRYMSMLSQNVDRLLKLINDLMDSSKIDSGRFKLFKEENNIVYVVEDAVMSLKNLTDQKGIDLIFDTEIEECMMSFDATAIDRCVVNIVNNAAKFTEAGGEIIVYVSEENDETIKIEIKDTGCGIAKDNLENIFDRFNQGENSRKEASVGSGLGLTITKRLINLHKGEIYVDSEIGKGSIFTILIPKCVKE